MSDGYIDETNWQDILQQLSLIRTEEDYSGANVDLINAHLDAEDDRIRGGAVLAAEGCLFEPGILDRVLDLAENDPVPGIRRAAIKSISAVINEGVVQGFEDGSGANTALDDAEEWEEFQEGAMQADYQRAKYLLFNYLEDDNDPESQEVALFALADLGFLSQVRERIRSFLQESSPTARQMALQAIGRYPQYWEDELLQFINLQTPIAELKEAISSAFSSKSRKVAAAIESVLRHQDPEVLRYAVLTLANIGKSEKLSDILQHYSLHKDEAVRAAAREGIDIYTRNNFDTDFPDED